MNSFILFNKSTFPHFQLAPSGLIIRTTDLIRSLFPDTGLVALCDPQPKANHLTEKQVTAGHPMMCLVLSFSAASLSFSADNEKNLSLSQFFQFSQHHFGPIQPLYAGCPKFYLHPTHISTPLLFTSFYLSLYI